MQTEHRVSGSVFVTIEVMLGKMLRCPRAAQNAAASIKSRRQQPSAVSGKYLWLF
jgi:hypothetical protein